MAQPCPPVLIPSLSSAPLQELCTRAVKISSPHFCWNEKLKKMADTALQAALHRDTADSLQQALGIVVFSISWKYRSTVGWSVCHVFPRERSQAGSA